MNIFPDTTPQTDIEEEILRAEKELNEIVVYNDDFNTFDFVIETLMKYCNHEPEQAAQFLRGQGIAHAPAERPARL